MITYDPFPNIRTTIASLTQEGGRPWAQIGHLLDQVEKSGYWQGEATSFSEWLRTFASRLRLGEASLWRYLTSARYYQELRQTLNGHGVTCPQLEDLPSGVSPENLELLAKLARVAPDDILKGIAAQVVGGSIKRAEMRRVWEVYRPALEGRTARGTRVAVPTIDPTDLKQFDSLVEAQIFTALMSSGIAWTGLKQPYLYEVFLHVAPEFGEQVRQRFEFDAVAMMRANKNTETEFHGIEIRSSKLLHKSTFELLESQRPYCHFLWLAINECEKDEGNYYLPEYVGVLVARANTVRVLQHAQRNPGELTGDLAKGLLLKALRR